MAVLKYKDGSGQFVPISNYTVQPLTPVQTTGTSTTEVMSQNAVTTELGLRPLSEEVYTKTQSNNLIFGQNDVPTGTGAADNVQKMIYQTVYNTISPTPQQTGSTVVTTENLATTLSDYATNQAIADFFDYAEYTDGTGAYVNKKVIAFYHGGAGSGHTLKVQVDATEFVKDGMVSNVEIKNVSMITEYDLKDGETGTPTITPAQYEALSDGDKAKYEAHYESVKCLVITFNTGAGKEDINIPITEIFDASNYVSKAEMDSQITTALNDAFSAQNPSADQIALKQAIANAVADAIEEALGQTGTTPAILQEIKTVIQGYTYTPQGGSEIALTDVMEASHTHSNKNVLDGINGIDSSISSGSQSTNLPTTAAVASFVSNNAQTIKGAGTAFGANDAVNIVAGSNVTVTSDASAKTITIASSYTDTNQTIKGNGVTFGTDEAVDIIAGSNVTVTGDASNKTITIASSYTDTNQQVKAGNVTFGSDDVVNFVAGSNVTVTGDAYNKEISIAATDQSVTAAANHYTPTKDSSATKTASGATGTSGTSLQVVTAIETDGKGHVTGIVSGEATDTDNNTEYTFASGSTDGAFQVTPTGGSASSVSVYGVLKGSIMTVSANSGINYSSATKPLPADGSQIHIIYTNTTSADTTVALPTGGSSPAYMIGGSDTITVPKNGYAEANFMRIGGTVYVRGL